jgi:hypothetical protein
MTDLGRSTTICCLFIGVVVSAAPSWAQTRPPIAEQIAKTYGLDAYDKIEAIHYTFNLQLPGWISPVPGSGSPRPAKSPMREKTKTASR